MDSGSGSSLRSRAPQPGDESSTELASDAALLLSDVQKQLDTAVENKQYRVAARLQGKINEINRLTAPPAESSADESETDPLLHESETDPLLLTDDESKVAARLFCNVQEAAVEEATDGLKGCTVMCCGVFGMLWAILYFDLPV